METANRRYAEALGDSPGTARGLPLSLIGYWEGGVERGWPSAAHLTMTSLTGRS